MTEVQVYYFNNGQYASRKFVEYETGYEANEVYKKTIKKFKLTKEHALITLRDFNNGKWTLIKSERT